MRLPVMFMTLLVSCGALLAQQSGGAGQAKMDWPSLVLMFGSMFAVIYFFMIRPEQKKQKDRQKLLAAMAKGDKVVSIGGIHGRVQQVKESTIMVKVADNMVLEFTKSAISSIVAKEGAESKDKEKPAAVEGK